ncbi:13764_t:CDS:2 [Ambispora leptoticha]|uniref:13764_t:CDS:1 n=1 Tax=Ambispora leptoticha TaxID=144679 RepID=A0A9N9EBY1_9GLOM|nr:13764_t:CDS:2 [Ambispora leptoticha]
MTTEQTWEEIAEWEYEEEDIELAKHITVHSIPNPVSIDVEDNNINEVEDDNDEAAKRMVAQNEIAASDSKVPSATINFEDDEVDDEASNLHLINESPGARSAARRANAHAHKLQAKRLQAQLVSNTELEFWENSARGDTNRNPEFVKSKICKKAMKYNKGVKKDRKGLEKFKTEVW